MLVYHRQPGCGQGVRAPVLCPVTNDLPPGLTARPLTTDDLDAVFAVYSGAELEDSGHLALEPEDIAGDWARPSFDLATDSIGVFDGERLVGAAEVTTGWGARRGRRAAGRARARDRVVARGVDRAASDARWGPRGSARWHRTGRSPSACCSVAATRWGTRRGCSSSPRAARSRSGPLPPGLHPRHRGHGGAGARRLRRHPGRVRRVGGAGAGPFEDWAATTVRRPGAEPWQLRVVEHDGVVVAASFTILDSQGAGYVHQLAVERTHRGQGLAQSLLADAFAQGARATARLVASCRPTHGPARSTSTSRSAWRSPRSGRTW